MKLHSLFTLLALVAAVPAVACPGPARNGGLYRNVSPNTEVAARRYSYSGIYNLEAYDCAIVTNWYNRYGWYMTTYPAHRSIVGRGWHFGRGR